MERGYLTISVTGGGVAVPINGATVKFFLRKYSPSGSYDTTQVLLDIENEVNLRSATTDSSGKTQSLTLKAPDRSKSFEKEGESPYSVADVYVEKSGYFGALYLGVQIFPRCESILPVRLQPYVKAAVENGVVAFAVNGNYSTIYRIPKLTMTTNEENKPPEEQYFEPFIADEVYIPEAITVHLGRPEENAENVTVGFREYIKNVASSEIYPTWPESAIRANIYAQISIALNRVYTEWYQSKGYPFQITSSTAFDQAYVNGRNIYGNIERIVDEIFNTYISRKGYQEPLFAAYCDGVETTCNGMTQWGSFELANRGYTPVEILKHYYGEETVLTSTDNIMGIEMTYKGIPLSLGSIGQSVEVIQKQLNRIRQDYPKIPFIVNTNGVFGADTDSAVRQFQDIFNLATDGVVGKATWYKLSYVYVSVKRLGELESEGQKPEYRPIDTNVLLSRGSVGEDVRVLQYLLEYISVFFNDVQPLGIDGIFGNETYVSLMSFQKAFGIEISGTTTSKTWQTLYEVYDSIQRAVLPTNDYQLYPGAIKQGSTGEAVRLLQKYLNAVAEYYGGIPTLVEDGIFGSGTRNALAEFQRIYLFDDTGILDAPTWYRLVELYNYIQKNSANT